MTSEQLRDKYNSLIQDDTLLQIEVMGRNGESREKIAEYLHISKKTLLTLEHALPEFANALKRGREDADRLVENALFKSATGYVVELEKPVKVRQTKYENNKRYDYEEIQYVTDRQYIKPDNASMIFFLKNRLPDLYRDKREIRSDVSGGVVVLPTIDNE